MLTSLNYSMNYGLSVWEGVRTYNGKALFLSAHLQRLRDAAITLMPSATFDSFKEMRAKIKKIIDEKNYEFGYLRPILYVGADEKSYIQEPFHWKFDVHHIPATSIYSVDDKEPHCILAGFFSSDTDYGFRRPATQEFLKIPANYWNVDRSKIRFNTLIRQADRNIYEIEKVDEVLFRRDSSGYQVQFVEAGFSNIVAMNLDDDQINIYVISPAPDVLKGITGQWLLAEASQSLNVHITWKSSITAQELANFEEILLVGTHMEIKSITEIYTMSESERTVERVWKSNPVRRFGKWAREAYFKKINEKEK